MESGNGRAVLVTGGTGFIGSFLGLRLLEEGYQVFFLARRKNNKDARERIRGRLLTISQAASKYDNNWQVLDGDVTLQFFGLRENDLKKLQSNKISKIFHCAALLSFGSDDEELAYKINVRGAENAVELVSFLEAELHYLSTAYIAGNRTGEIREDEFDEGQNFRNIYEKTKFEAEKIVRRWRDFEGGRAVIYRPSIVIGDSRTGLTFSFTGYYAVARFFWNIAKFFRKEGEAVSNFPLLIPVVRDSTLNLITVDAVVDAIFKLSEKGGSLGRVFHIVHPYPPKNSMLFETSIKFLGFPRVRIWSVSLYTLRTLARLGWLLSFLLGRVGRFFRRQVITYVPYFEGSATFKVERVKEILGDKYSPPLITEEVIKRVLVHAIKVKFSDDDYLS